MEKSEVPGPCGKLSGLAKSGNAIIGFVVLLVSITVMVCYLGERIFTDELVINPIEVAPALQEKGYTPRLIEDRLMSQIDHIRTVAYKKELMFKAPVVVVDMPIGDKQKVELQNRAIEKPRVTYTDVAKKEPFLRDNPTEKFDIKIKEVGFSLQPLIRRVRTCVKHKTIFISADLLLDTNNALRLRIKVNDEPSITISDNLSNLDKMLLEAAQYAYKYIDPYTAAVFFLKQDDTAAAIDIVKRVIAEEPPDKVAWAYSMWGTVLTRQKKYEDAIKMYKAELALAPKRYSTYLNLAELYSVKGEYDAAIANIVKAREHATSHIKPLLVWGNILSARGQQKDAIRKYGEALKADPRFAPAHLALAIEYFKQGQYESSIAALDNAILYAPEITEEADKFLCYSYTNWGVALYNGGNMAETKQAAIEKYQKAIEIYPACGPAYVSLGYVYATSNDFIDAVATYETGFAAGVRQPALYVNWVFTLVELGRYDDARNKIQELPASAPDNPLYYVIAGSVLDEKLKDFKGAGRMFQAAIKIDPTYCAAYVNWAGMLHKLKDDSRANTTLSKAIKNNSSCITAHYNLGSIYESRGKQKEACQQFKKVIELEPEGDRGRQAREVSERLKCRP